MVKPPFLRTPYNYDTNKAGDESGLECKDKSLTQQSGAEECDINYLVERFTVTGEMPQLSMPPLQGDFTEVLDFQGAMNKIVEANSSFMQLPAKIRSRFENDPGQFVAFCSDEKNRDELRQMGLWSPEANARFAAQARAAQDLADANAAAADELKTLKKGKGDTQKGVT